ncbi:MAG: hypothetical protein ACI9XO_001765 [Paraglaciecola sp.]|jgi:hypothetical protein
MVQNWILSNSCNESEITNYLKKREFEGQNGFIKTVFAPKELYPRLCKKSKKALKFK